MQVMQSLLFLPTRKCRAVGYSLDPEDLRNLKIFDGNAHSFLTNDFLDWKIKLQQPYLHLASGFGPS